MTRHSRYPTLPAQVVLFVLLLLAAPAALAQTTVKVSGPTGSVTQELPAEGGPFALDIPLAGNAVNTLTVSATDEHGNTASEELAITQISLDSIVVAEVTTEQLSVEEIEELVNEGVIDLEDPENYNVSKFAIVITVEGEPVEIVVHLPQPIGEANQGGEERIPFPQEDEPAGRQPPSPREIVVFEELIPTEPGEDPISLPGVLFIEGRIKSLKEFFSVRLLLLNTSGIFTLSDVGADIVLPEGALSNALPASGRVVFDDIVPGDGQTPGQAEREFIVRGDEIGVHDVEVQFGGYVTGPGIPDDEPIAFNGSAGATLEVKGPPTFEVRVQHPDSVIALEPYDLRVDILNTGDSPALYTSLDLDVGADMELLDCAIDQETLEPYCVEVEGPVTRAMGHILPGEQVSETFRVRSLRTGLISSCFGVADQNITLQVTIGNLGCLAGSFPSTAGVPTGVPTVSVAPTPNATGVSPSSPVTAFFSDMMNTSSIRTGEGGSFNVYHGGRLVPGELRFDTVFDRTIAVWQVRDGSSVHLDPNTEYTVLITEDITSLAGEPLYSEWMSSFSTTGLNEEDVTPPELSLSILPPVDPNLVLPGQVVEVSAYATDQGSGVSRIEARIKDLDVSGARYELIDQKTIGEGQLPPVLFAIETTDLVPGHAYQVLGTAYDGMGNPRDASTSFVLAASADPPTITLPDDPPQPWLQGISLDLTPREVTGGTHVVRYYLDGEADPFKTVYVAPYKASLRTVDLDLGAHTVRAVATDGLDQTGDDTLSFELVENPSMPRVDFGASRDGAVYLEGESFIVDGNAQDEVGIASVEFYLDEISKSGPIATGTEPFLFDTTGLSPGTHGIIQLATNELGVQNDPDAPESVLEFTVTEPQVGPPPPPPVIVKVSPPVDGQVTVEGTSVAGARVDVTNETQGFAVTVYADGAGQWSAILDGSGGDTISAVATDVSQSSESSEPATDVVPMPPVLVSIDAQPDSMSFDAAGASEQLAVTASWDDGSTSDVTAPSTYVTSNAKVASVSQTGLVVAHANGTAVITVSYEGFSDTTTVTVDTGEDPIPTADIVSPEDGSEVERGESVSVTVEAADEAGGVTRVNLEVRGETEYDDERQISPPQASTTQVFTFDVADDAAVGGIITVEAWSRDTSSQLSERDHIELVVVDHTAPDVTTTEPAPDSQYNYGDTITIVVEATDAVGVSEIGYQTRGAFERSDSQVIDPATEDASATFELEVPYGVQESDLWIDGYALDAAGNRGEAAPVYVEITVSDITPPATEATAITDPGSGTTATVSYRVTEGLDDLDHVELYFRRDGYGTFNRYTNASGGNPDGHFTPDASGEGEMVFDSTRMGGDGDYEFYTVGVDASGNREAPPDDGSKAVVADVSATFAAGTAWSVIDADTTIADGDTTFDGKNLRITGARVTIAGSHAFHNVELVDGGVLTHPETTLTADYAVNLEAWTLTVEEGASIDVSSRGYLGGLREGNDGTGQTLGNADGSTMHAAGSYGGLGGATDGTPNTVYGDLTAPVDPGSGGSAGSYERTGGDGGGVVIVRATNVVNDGSVMANGASGTGYSAGSGSGGSIYLVVSSLSGRGGMSANGAAYELGGGGGRIAIHYTDIVTYDTGLLEALGGDGSQSDGGNGTVFLKGTDESAGTLVIDGQGTATSYSPLPVPPGYVFDNIVLQNSARVLADDPLEVSDSLEVLTGSILTHSTASEDGVQITARRVYVDETSSIDVSGRGYRAGLRDGNTAHTGETLGGLPWTSGGSGGAYGGFGGATDGATPGIPYGQPDSPQHLGSGGSAGSFDRAGGNGGGLVRIDARDEVRIDGAIRADGLTGDGYSAGSGSGGGIAITTSLLKGSGSIEADGGANEVGGGGGRIAIDYAYISSQSETNLGDLRNIHAFGGHGSKSWGSAGTVLLRRTDQEWGDLYVDDDMSDASSTAWTPLTHLGFGAVADLTADTLTTDGLVQLLPGGLVGMEINPNLDQQATFTVIANDETTLTVDVSGGTNLTDVAGVGDTYAGIDRFDNIVFRRGGFFVAGDRIVVEDTVTIDEHGKISHYDATLDFESRIDLTAGTVLVAESGAIDVNGRGYLGGLHGGNDGTGQTVGNADGATMRSAGSYGGLGGQTDGTTNPVYGSVTNPSDLGSGGSAGSYDRAGGDGGGRVFLAAGTLEVNGSISANGLNGNSYSAGSGSGGTVALDVGTLSGSGHIRANGGAHEVGGGGGRIAVRYDELTMDTSLIEVHGGQGSQARGGNGTLFLKGPEQTYGDLVIDGHDQSTPDASSPIPGGYDFDNLILRNGARCVADEGISVRGSVELLSGSVLTHSTEHEDGLVIETGSLYVDSTSAVDVSRRGYRGGRRDGNASDSGLTLGGLEGAPQYAGGSYGGYGGVANDAAADVVYGMPADANHLGAGGGAGGFDRIGGNGGGLMDITADDEVVIDGALRADGGQGDSYSSASGSGGSIRVRTALLAGTGFIEANGGAFEVGGGGGRVAIDYTDLGEAGNDLAGLRNIRALGGHGSQSWGSAGTVVLRRDDQAYGDLYVDDNVADATSGAWTPLTHLGFGSITALTDDTLTTDGRVKLIPNGLVGMEINPNLEQDQTFFVVSNTETTVTVNVDAGPPLTDIAQVGDTYAGVHRFDNVRFRRGGFLVSGDRLVVVGTMNIDEYGTLTHFDATLEFVSRLDLTVDTLTIAETGRIDATGRGYLGGLRGGNDTSGQTLGNVDGSSIHSAGSYGGLGGATDGAPNPVYGSETDPRDLGSGGSAGSYGNAGGDGGGRIFITAERIDLAGSILANGLAGGSYSAGSGSGGTIAIHTGDLAGLGVIRADGGAHELGGGGGRVAITFDWSDLPTENITADGGAGSQASGSPGSVALP